MGKKCILGGIICLLVATIVLAFIHREEEILSDVFSSPSRMGEFELYGQNNIKFTFYKPVLSVGESEISKEMLKKVNFDPLINESEYDYNEKKIFVAEYEDKKSKDLIQHIQIQYFWEDGSFIIFSAYEVDEFDIDLIKEDLFGNQVTFYKQNDQKIVHIELTTNGALAYTYYLYNEEDNSISLMYTVANEIFTYKNGVLYHVAYTMNIDKNNLISTIDRFAN